ncbi:uncharacterized protein LOC117225965 [Megalopta genalis]|uniref:uncharacterized protein LOC117225965 n=1 Tax=Megalopta genalis TaxID=115081 RepID=UPI003FD0412D
MPGCEIWCPLLRDELKKIVSVSQAPWIWNEQQLASGARDGETADWDLDRDRDDRKEERTTARRVFPKRTIYAGEEGEKGNGTEGSAAFIDGAGAVTGPEKTRPGSPRQLSDIDGVKNKVESATQSPRDAFSQAVEEWDAQDPFWSRPIVRTAEMEMETETETRIKKDKEVFTAEQPSSLGTDGGIIKKDELVTSDVIRFEDECEPTCPRRISRKNRIRKLEERQKIVDTYLLNKGTRYFDNVCTCSLSCIVRALKQDTFVKSIIASVALFAFGMKLCTEFDAWYLPIRLS